MAAGVRLCGTALAFAAVVWAQALKRIEVASVNPSGNGVAESNLDSVRGRLTCTNMTVQELIRFAYSVPDYRIERAPKWIGSERFDIVVKKAGGETGSLEDERSLVRELLADRFQLTAHREQKQASVYLLVVSRDGPKLKPHTDSVPKTRGGCGRLVGRRVTADGIAGMLSRQVEHHVIDRTGLAGEYDFQLDFTPDSGACRTAADDPSNQPSIYTAIQQQLGLRLEAAKGSVEVVVIDRVEKPSQN